MNGWESFLVAEVGASAALTGLIFVSVSINLKRILSFPKLPNRAFGALLMFSTVLIVSSLLLVPHQPQIAPGIEILIIGLLVWVTITIQDINYWRNTKSKYRNTLVPLALMNQVSILCYVVSGILILVGIGIGFYLIVPAFLLSMIKGLLDAWVLLVEINR